MKVEGIRLINFRNYDNLDLSLDKNINIFIGRNAQGKTNLLESIYICAIGKSFRSNRDKEIVSFSKNEAYIGARINIGGLRKLIEIKMHGDRPKRIRVNQIELKRYNELLAELNVVLFSPDDLRLIKDGPSERRDFLDTSISQMRPVYKYNVSKYSKVLAQRNNLLKSNESKSNIDNIIEVFDLQLARLGTQIIISRLKFIEGLSQGAGDIHYGLSLGEELSLSYNTNVDISDRNKNLIEKNFLDLLKQNMSKDLYMGSTSIGPHRDDIQISIDGLDARTFGSQGQQRTTVLSIKLSEVEIIKKERGVYPVVLLDDVFSELDKGRRKYLISLFKDIQIIITSTDIIDLNEFGRLEKSIFHIEGGKIK